MFTVLSIIFKAVTGNLSGIISTIANSNAAKYGAEATVDVAALQASTDAYKTRVSMLSGMKYAQWLIILALMPPILHQGAVYLDSIPFWLHDVGSWHVPAAPKPYDDREWSLISSLLGIQSGLAVGIGIIGGLLSKL